MKRVLVVGDTHGSSSAIDIAMSQALDAGCDAIVQVGDFGYWPHFKSGERFIETTSKTAALNNIPIYWVDGNHENHDYIDVLTAEHGYKQPIEIAPGVFYLPRSCVWEWEGVRLCALGGAWSIDQQMRKSHVTWWEQETISEADMFRILDVGQVDVLFTHDAPIEVDCLGGRADVFPSSQANREHVSAAEIVTAPSLLIHGHYHRRYEEWMPGTPETRVIGLAADGNLGSSVVLELDAGNVEVKP